MPLGDGRVRIIFEMSPAEKEWIQELVKASPHRYNIDLLRELLDTYAELINFKPRPK